MIWFFLAGMIAGAVGWHMFIQFLGKRIEQRKQIEALRGKKEESSDDGDGV